MDKGAQQMEAPPPPQPTGALVQTTLSFGRTMHVHRPASVASSSATPLSSVSTLNVNDSPGAQGETSVSGFTESSILSSAEAYVRRDNKKVKQEGPSQKCESPSSAASTAQASAHSGHAHGDWW